MTPSWQVRPTSKMEIEAPTFTRPHVDSGPMWRPARGAWPTGCSHSAGTWHKCRSATFDNAIDPATLLSMSSPVLGLWGEDSGHNNHEPLERRGHALTKSRVLVRMIPSRGSAGRR